MKATRKHFGYFVAYYLWNYVRSEFADFHYDMMGDIHDLLNHKIRELGWFMFGESAKTSFAKALILYMIAFDIEPYINADAFDSTNSERILFDVVWELQMNKRFIDDFGQKYNTTRSKDEVTQKRIKDFVTNPIRDQEGNIVKEGIRVEAHSTQESVRGRIHGAMRPGFVLLDDFETKKTLRSDVATTQIRTHIQEFKRGLDSRRRRVMYLGNILSEYGNIQSIIERAKHDPELRVRIVPICLGTLDDMHTPIWPERWTLTDEEAKVNGKVSIESKKRSMWTPEDGDSDFQAEMLCQPIDETKAIFKREWFQPISWQGAKQGLVSGSVWGTAQGATRAMQDNKSNSEIAEDALTGGVVGGVAGGTVGAVVGGTSGYLNRRREINNMLKTASTPDEAINSLHDDIAKHADENVFKASIKNGDLTIDQVYQKDGALNPELAKGRIDDIAANLDLKVPGAGEKYRTLIDPNKTTFDELISKADDVIDESRKIPADLIKYSVGPDGKKVVDAKATEALKAGIADQDVAFIKNASAQDKEIFDKAMKVAEQASKDKTYSRQPIEQAGKVLIEQADTVEGARQKVGQDLGILRAKLGNNPVTITDTADIFYKDLDDAGIKITNDGLDFSKSKYANVPKVQKIIESVHQRIAGLGDQTDVKTVDMIRQQLGTEVDLGTLEGNLDKSAKRILQKVYGGLGDNIAYIDTDYAELSNEYSKLTSAMDYFQRALGKDFEATKINSSLRAGEVGRRILGNGSSRPLAIVENIQDLARTYGYDKSVDARSQFLFANFLEDLFGNTQSQSLQQQITKGVNNAEEASGALTDVATGNASGLLSKAVRKGINLVRNITPERQIEAVRALLK